MRGIKNSETVSLLWQSLVSNQKERGHNILFLFWGLTGFLICGKKQRIKDKKKKRKNNERRREKSARESSQDR